MIDQALVEFKQIWSKGDSYAPIPSRAGYRCADMQVVERGATGNQAWVKVAICWVRHLHSVATPDNGNEIQR